MFGRALLLLQLHRSSTLSGVSQAAVLAAQGTRKFTDMVDRASLNPRGEHMQAVAPVAVGAACKNSSKLLQSVCHLRTHVDA